MRMTRNYEIFKKDRHENSPTLRPEYQAIYDSAVEQKDLIQSKKRHFDITLAKMPPPRKAAAKAQVQTEKAEIRQAMLLCETELRRGEEALQEILHVEATMERDFPVTRAAEREVTRMVAKVNREIEEARQSLKDLALTIQSEAKSRKAIKLEPHQDKITKAPQRNSGLEHPTARLLKPPKFMEPRVKKLSKRRSVQPEPNLGGGLIGSVVASKSNKGLQS
jgi:hypothetical protein